MEKELTLLVTGAGAPGIRGTLYALKNNEDGVRVRIIGTDLRSDVVGRYMVDRFYQVPSPEAPAYIESLQEICKSEGVRAVIPQTTRETEVLSRRKQHFERDGIGVMVSDSMAIEIANNKWKLLQLFDELGLPVPRWRLTTCKDELVDCVKWLGYPDVPVAVKPPVSNGMRGFRILRENAWDLRRFLSEKPSGEEIELDSLLAMLKRGDSWPPLLVTEFLSGVEYSVDAFIGKSAQIVIPRIRKSIRSGISFVNSIEMRHDLIDYTLQAATRLDLRYAFGFQYKLDNRGEPKVLECNPRIQGTMVASVFSGINVIWASVRELIGSGPTSFPQPAVDVQFLRYWGGLGVSGENVHEI